MMTTFHESGLTLQIILLVLSQLTVIILTGSCILLFKRKCRQSKQICVGTLFLLNVVLYALMQLDSRITSMDQSVSLYVPSAVLLTVTILSLLLGVGMLWGETINRKLIDHRDIKESFDNLPTGVCFFNEAGFPMLCNSAMHRFSFAVCNKDIQFITDLEECLEDEFLPTKGTIKEGNVFVLSDGTAWHLEKRIFDHESGRVYTQYIATDVTDLQRNRVELMRENTQLRKAQAELKKLSANVVVITREEEILNTKMRVHDEMGKCLMEAQRYLKEESNASIPDSVIASWKKAVSMIKYNNDTKDEDMLIQIRKTCETLKLSYIQTGKLPMDETVAYILTCAVRECVTNAVRYADASELYVEFNEKEESAAVIVSNNGKRPDSEIIEGGGLSTLRRRVERAGGSMSVQSFPEFKLTVEVPKGRGGVI